jgi:hypothetical protein
MQTVPRSTHSLSHEDGCSISLRKVGNYVQVPVGGVGQLFLNTTMRGQTLILKRVMSNIGKVRGPPDRTRNMPLKKAKTFT